jgi:hypothetical protein
VFTDQVVAEHWMWSSRPGSGRMTRYSERANVGGNAQAGLFEAAVIAPDSCCRIPLAPPNIEIPGP